MSVVFCYNNNNYYYVIIVYYSSEAAANGDSYLTVIMPYQKTVSNVGDISSCHTWGTLGMEWAGARDAAQHPQYPGCGPT